MPAKKKSIKKPDIDIQVRNLDKIKDWDKDCCGSKKSNWSGCGGFGYFLGFLGAAIYYISTATGFWNGVLGFLKAIVWPAFVVFEILKFVGA
jgi:hypothetical protein